MKKLIVVVVVLLMLFSVTSYADAYDSLVPDTKSGLIKAEVTFECDDISALENIAISDDFLSMINVSTLTYGMSDLSAEYQIGYEFNDDYTAGKIAIVSDMFVPIKLNKNFELTVKTKMGSWYVYDVSDESNPVVQLITQNLEDEKYVVYNVVDILKADGYDAKTICSEFKKSFNAETVNAYFERIKDIYRANSTLTTKPDGYTLTMTAEQANKFIDEMISAFSDVMSMMSGEAYDDFASEIAYLFEDGFRELHDECTVLLATEGTTDKNGNTQSAVSEMTISIDVEQADETTKPITIKLMEKYEYLPIGGNAKVEIPELTDKNSKPYNMPLYYDDYYVDYCSYIEVDCEYIKSEPDSIYLSLESILTQMRENSHPLTVSQDGDTIIISDISDCENFETIKLTVGSCAYEIDAGLYNAANPVTVADGLVYIDDTIVKQVFGYEVIWGYIDLVENTVCVDVNRVCPNDKEVSDEPESEYDFCWHIQDLKMPIEIEIFKEGYFGLRNAVESHSLGNNGEQLIDIYYDNGVITLKNNGSAEYFSEARITVGSNVVNVDGVDYNVSLPAINRDGTVFVDKDTIKAILKYEFRGARVEISRNRGTDDENPQNYEVTAKEIASFMRVSPLCSHFGSVNEYFDN